MESPEKRIVLEDETDAALAQMASANAGNRGRQRERHIDQCIEKAASRELYRTRLRATINPNTTLMNGAA